uniref:Transposase n=1 Tax=Steinernema glaseri TaxID=37863 RepID=A0A1I8AMW7_9BILA
MSPKRRPDDLLSSQNRCLPGRFAPKVMRHVIASITKVMRHGVYHQLLNLTSTFKVMQVCLRRWQHNHRFHCNHCKATVNKEKQRAAPPRLETIIHESSNDRLRQLYFFLREIYDFELEHIASLIAFRPITQLLERSSPKIRLFNGNFKTNASFKT